MGRRRFLLISLASVVAARLGAEAQQAKVPRIGVLAPAEPSVDDPVLQGFRAGLGELGYIEGRNIAIDYVFAHGRTERFPDLVAQLARRNLDVAVVGSTRAALDAKEGLQATSIVFVGAVDPVTLGLVASLARPGGNVTGLSFAYETGLGGKWVELLHAAVPRARRVAILRDPNYASDSASIILRSFERAGQRLGLKMTIFDVGGPDQIGATFAAIARDRSDAVLVQPVPFFNTHLRAVVDYAVRNRLPGMFPFRSHVEAGGLMSYGVSLSDLWRRAAGYVDKILKGAKPADLPVEQPIKYELAINLKTAKALGLTIPPSLLARADQVIE
jgi:putative ABC transport system substrate-binding protein